jgi:serpin B
VEDGCQFLSQAIQKTAIEVDEMGTVAAAATALMLRGGGPPQFEQVPLFLADHPFQFFIVDEESHIVLFEGRVGAPTASSIPSTDSHTDDTFWDTYDVDAVAFTPASREETNLPSVGTTPAPETLVPTTLAPTTLSMTTMIEGDVVTTTTQQTTASTQSPTTSPPETRAPTTSPPETRAPTTVIPLELNTTKNPVLVDSDGSLSNPTTSFEDSLLFFADNLTGVLYEDPNECTSAWGISMAFDLVYPGSDGDTEAQICSVMGLCGDAYGQPQFELLWQDSVNQITSKYDGSCLWENLEGCGTRRPLVTVANSVWIDRGLTLQAEYISIVGELVQTIDFSSEEAGSTVNEWVNASTLGLIDSIIGNGPQSGTLMIALNAIYFKAQWSDTFSESHTTTDDFYHIDSTQVKTVSQVRFMHKAARFPYSDNEIEGHQIIKLGYDNSDLSMVIALPTASILDGSNNPISPAVSSKQIMDVLPRLSVRKVALALPKFIIESHYGSELDKALQSLGLTAAYATPGFCGLVTGCLSLTSAIHKTYIEVDEKGTIAAAVTALVFNVTASIPQREQAILFLANHPFQFFIVDEALGLVLFEGRVGAPTVTETPAPTDGERHDSATFWDKRFDVDLIVPTRPPSWNEETQNPSSSDSLIGQQRVETDDEVGPEEEKPLQPAIGASDDELSASSSSSSIASCSVVPWKIILVGSIILSFK